MNEKTPLEILDEIKGILKRKKQVRYFSIAGFSFLLVHAFTHLPLLLFISLVLLGASIFRHIQVRAFSIRNAKEINISSNEPDQKDLEEKAVHVFESNRAVPSVSLQFDNAVYELSFLHKKENWEDDDILLCKSDDREVNIHPSTFLKYLESTDCDYLHDQDQSFIESLKDTPCLKFGYLEYSRDYPSIRVTGNEVSLMCKYLCPVFYIFKSDEDVVLVVDELRDEDGEDVPTIITSLKEYIFRESTVEFSAEENAWIQK